MGKERKMKKAFFLLLSVFIIFGTVYFLNAENSLEGKDMSFIISVLKSHNIDYFVFSNSQGNKFLVVPQFGARILAVSVGGENLFWTHPDVLKGQGGQRSWISPEGGAKGFIFRPD